MTQPVALGTNLGWTQAPHLFHVPYAHAYSTHVHLCQLHPLMITYLMFFSSFCPHSPDDDTCISVETLGWRNSE